MRSPNYWTWGERMSKRKKTVTEDKHGQLDPDASARLEDLLDAAKRGGFDVTAGELMSRAVRLYHAAASDRVVVTAVTHDDKAVN